MLVTGGRFGWARALWSGALVLGVGALVGTAACGSRTSMLDPDAYYGTIGGGGGTSSSPTGHAGKTSSGSAGHPTGTGGATTTPIGGTGSGATTGVDPSRASVTCQQYCPGYGTQCVKRLKGRECLPTCQGELTTFGPICENLGINALQCLTPFFSPQGGNCDDAVNRALTQCGKIVQAFEDCKKQFSSGKSPGGLPVGGVASCPRTSGPTPGGNCAEIFDCNNGPYVTSCNLSPQTMLLDCGCVSPSGNAPTARLPFTSDPCLAAAALCQ